MSQCDSQEIMERRARLLGPAYRLFYDDPVHLVRGEGVWLYDSAGQQYLDMYNNVAHVGHCHPRVADALDKQIRILNTHTRYLHDNVLDYAERLTGTLPEPLAIAMFSCTGTEANELALRIARTCTNGTGIIVVDNAYHGNSHALAEVSASYESGEGKPEYVETVAPPDCYRGKYRDEDAAEKYAAEVQRAVARLHERGIQPAALMIDTIVSSNGILDVPAGYLRKAAAIIRDAGGLFIADEVQPGFGRTGEHFWGFEKDNVVPDIVTMGKPIGNGHPLAATITRNNLLESFAEKSRYFNTFGGNPVSAAAGLAVLAVLHDENLVENARVTGAYLIDGLRDIAGRFDVIGDVRGSGLFVGVDLVEDRETRNPATGLAHRLVNALRECGVLTNTIGKQSNILKLRPPMPFSSENADMFLEIFARELAQSDRHDR